MFAICPSPENIIFQAVVQITTQLCFLFFPQSVKTILQRQGTGQRRHAEGHAGSQCYSSQGMRTDSQALYTYNMPLRKKILVRIIPILL